MAFFDSLISVTFIPRCRVSESLTVWGETWSDRERPRTLGSLYRGGADAEENGWSMRPTQLRLRGVDSRTGAGGEGVSVASSVDPGVPAEVALDVFGALGAAEGC